jgi:hypothetical protein
MCNTFLTSLSSVLANQLLILSGDLRAKLWMGGPRFAGRTMDMAYHDLMLGGGIVRDVYSKRDIGMGIALLGSSCR